MTPLRTLRLIGLGMVIMSVGTYLVLITHVPSGLAQQVLFGVFGSIAVLGLTFMKYKGSNVIHKQVPVKVNAHVDEMIVPLVEALSTYKGLITTSSCEGTEAKEAYVAFFVGEKCEDLCYFISTLSPLLGQDSSVSDLPFSLTIEWYCCSNTPVGYVRVPKASIVILANAIAIAVGKLKEGITAQTKGPINVPPSDDRPGCNRL